MLSKYRSSIVGFGFMIFLTGIAISDIGESSECVSHVYTWYEMVGMSGIFWGIFLLGVGSGIEIEKNK